MKKKIVILLTLFLIFSCGPKTTESKSNKITEVEITELDISKEIVTESKPYETRWLEITKTDTGYVVYNYLRLWDDGETIEPTSITVKKDSLIWSTCFEPPAKLSLKNVKIEKRKDEAYFFPVGNEYLFTWYDKEKHIAQWTIYFGEKPLSSHLYVDSRYNTFPVVDYEWDESLYEDE